MGLGQGKEWRGSGESPNAGRQQRTCISNARETFKNLRHGFHPSGAGKVYKKTVARERGKKQRSLESLEEAGYVLKKIPETARGSTKR